ncbi:MAG: S8 family serine peptidase [Acidobacteriota bacterium]|nr:S8 family serine peptidase [Acidobacteriota bacterium]
MTELQEAFDFEKSRLLQLSEGFGSGLDVREESWVTGSLLVSASVDFLVSLIGPEEMTTGASEYAPYRVHPSDPFDAEQGDETDKDFLGVVPEKRELPESSFAGPFGLVPFRYSRRNEVAGPLGLDSLGILKPGDGVVVAVVDRGVEGHSEFEGRLLEGKAFGKAEDPHKDDGKGHGTGVAGLVAGKEQGVAPFAKILPLKVGKKQCDVFKAFDQAMAEGVDVICYARNFSANVDPVLWRKACESVLAAGILHAVALGNKGGMVEQHLPPANVLCPAFCPPPVSAVGAGGVSSAMAAGSFNLGDERARFDCSFGPSVWSLEDYQDYPCDEPLFRGDFYLPGGTKEGGGLLTALRGGGNRFGRFSGSSAAAACLAGVLAILAQKKEGVVEATSDRPIKIFKALLDSADEIKIRVGTCFSEDSANERHERRVNPPEAYRKV